MSEDQIRSSSHHIRPTRQGKSRQCSLAVHFLFAVEWLVTCHPNDSDPPTHHLHRLFLQSDKLLFARIAANRCFHGSPVLTISMVT